MFKDLKYIYTMMYLWGINKITHEERHQQISEYINHRFNVVDGKVMNKKDFIKLVLLFCVYTISAPIGIIWCTYKESKYFKS